jgi:hypothetical protein
MNYQAGYYPEHSGVPYGAPQPQYGTPQAQYQAQYGGGAPQPQYGAAQQPYGVPQGAPSLLDPTLLRAARHIYRSFYEANPDITQRPLGVALNRYNYRGKLIFGRKPVLLPQECFIPVEHIQAELY